jgi:asparagine synthase (glutamine-hydrolysing)
MCGIVGIVRLDPRESVDAARIVGMRDVLRHRGPDGAGILVDGPVGLGHRRLAIVDVAGGHQPMSNEDGRLWIVFNGEIYNHAALRRELQEKGHPYRSRSDTETILHLYEEEGDRCVERLRGMFAFALWDRARGRLLLARDRLGIKPLYYHVTDRELLFASEAKGLLAGGVRPALNEGALPELLATRSVAGEETLFQGVRKLLPGRTLVVTPGEGLVERRYWQLPAPGVDRVEAGSAPEVDLRIRLRDSVRSHLMSDVPLGLFLSGGIDSSGLLALMAPLVSAPVQTFAVGFDEPEANELPYARLAARDARADHREVLVTPRQFWNALPRLVWHEDEPLAFPSSVPLHFVSSLARQHGVKVVLTGEGADELFLGYNRYRVTAWNERIGAPYWRLMPAALRGVVARGVGFLPRGLRRYAERSFLALPPGPRSLFYENFSVFPERWRRRVVRPELLRGDPYAQELRLYAEGEGNTLDRMSRADLQTYLVRLLMKQDQMSMAASIESRVPYLDHEVVEHVAALPSRLKLHGFTTKAVLREALKHLVPRPILQRKKMGFPVPVGRWLRGPFWPLVEDLVLGPRALARGLFAPPALGRLAQEHRLGIADHADRLWLLMNLELWQRVFVDGEPSELAIRAA